MELLRQTVRHTVNHHDLLQAGDTVVVGLSGGADSVCLLHILRSLTTELSLAAIHAVHVNHGLRGAFADRDEAFVRELCKQWDVPLTIEHADVLKEAALNGESLEEAGRRCRYAAFSRYAASLSSAKIATAHSMTDCSETVLLNLVRGCGTAGFGGIPVKRGQIIRPLLFCSAEEIREYCRQNDLSYVVDETNSDTRFTRNRIRLEVLPTLSDINTAAVAHIARAASVAREEHAFVTSLAQRAWNEARQDNGTFCVERLKAMDTVLFTNGLQHVIKEAGGNAEQTHIHQIASLLNTTFSVSVPGDRLVRSDGVALSITTHRRYPTEASPVAVCKPPSELDFCGVHYRIRHLSAKEFEQYAKIHKNLFNFCVSYDMITDSTILRTRKEGDAFRPQRRQCTKTLKKWCNENNIPVSQRDRLPLLCDENGILAILGYAVDECAAVTDQTEHIAWFEVLY